ncbi:putative salicylate hydroxylase [Leptodontidium sp. 2 PMI_412]|nr:putative salicylate hydroxylase [Leptodontidium sp. 2 PMI_412]
MTKREIELAIVGGGIGGLALAAGLLHRGLNSQIYEAAPEFSEIGAGVAFGPNSVSAMSKIAPGVLEAYTSQSTENGDPKERATWFDFHHGVGDIKQIHKVAPRNAEVGLTSVHRAHFLDGLAALVPKDIAHFGKRLTSLEEQPSGRIKLVFNDETTAEADAVIGCDGVRSKVRPMVLGPESKNVTACYSNKYAYRGLVPMDKAAKVLGDYYARNGQMYLGPNGHVLTFPIEHGNTMNVVAFQTGTGSWEQERWVLPTPKEDRMQDFAQWNEKVLHILDIMEDKGVWALFDHPPAETFYKGRIALLGDAAHASTPHQGAGAGQALEDAFILSSLLGDDSVRTPSDIVAAFKAYDSVRRPRSQKVVTTSREAGMLYDFQDLNAGADPVKIKEALMGMYEWIWSENLDEQFEQSRRLLLQSLGAVRL